MVLETERLLLRPWDEADAETLYEYAKDPRVGPVAGWPAHTSVENSREVIGTVLSAPETYAVCLKADGRAIGCVSLMIGGRSNIGLPDTEGEIGYWIGVPFWGRGLIPEAVREIIRRAFVDLRLETLWCGWFDGNEQSRRVAEKCGFVFHRTNKDIFWPATGDVRTEHLSRLAKAEWTARTRETVLYVHGRGGCADEAAHYAPLFPGCTVSGVDYRSDTPWEAGREIREAVVRAAETGGVTLIANSIGAYFCMHAQIGGLVRRAFFISPVVDMQALIGGMMARAGVTPAQLMREGEIRLDSGETLSWEYLRYVRSHPVEWTVPTHILYGSLDVLTPVETIRAFAKAHGASLTVMENGEHWFHTDAQLRFLDDWLRKCR